MLAYHRAIIHLRLAASVSICHGVKRGKRLWNAARGCE